MPGLVDLGLGLVAVLIVAAVVHWDGTVIWIALACAIVATEWAMHRERRR